MKNLNDEIKETIVEVLNLNIKPNEIDDDVLLFEGGIGLDSIDGLELLVAVERKFDIEIDDNDLGSDIIKNVNNLAAFIQGKRNSDK